jgi:4a-hydroxytetrahydrobiopterin dehydratase
MTENITPQQFEESDGTADWRVLGEGAEGFFRTPSYARGAEFIQAIASLPGFDAHRPIVDLRHDGVTVRLLTRSPDGYRMSDQDVVLARGVSAAARELGLEAEPSIVQSLLIIPGAPDTAAVQPFWRAVTGYVPRPDSPEEDLVDAHDRGTNLWLERMREPRGDGGGAIHIAVWVPYEKAEERVAAALAAGGHMVRDDHAPAWWTLADAYGNEADVATTRARD